MTQPQLNINTIEEVMEMLQSGGFGAYREVFRIMLNEAMKVERSHVLNAGPYERTKCRKGHANGYKPKTVKTQVGEVTLSVPQTRGGVDFYPAALERGVRSERALKLAVAEMYVQGVSTRKVTEVMKTLCGLDVTSSQVSRAAAELDEGLEKWRARSLKEAPTPYLILDARYEKVRYEGAVRNCAVLIVHGVRADGKRTVLGVSVSLSEAEVHWRGFLKSLQDRGLYGVEYIVSDDHAGLKAALRARFPGTVWQRCQTHIQKNAQAYVTKRSMKAEVAQRLRDVFSAPRREEALERLGRMEEDYREKCPRLADWLEENVSEGLSVYSLPKSHRKRMRTSNMAENVNLQIRRRTRVAVLFPNPESALRLVTALLMEISEEWETGIKYLNMTDEKDEK